MVVENVAYAALEKGAKLTQYEYTIRDPLADEVIMKVQYCGICHSDLHHIDGDLPSHYPCVPGHEFVGVVDRVGTNVTKLKIGDKIAIGCVSGMCDACGACIKGDQQCCAGFIHTYGTIGRKQQLLYGGYGKYVVAREDICLRVPDSLPMDRAAPLLCAGITTYSPLKNNMCDRGHLKIGVVGLGGLGHMAVQFAKKLNPTNEVWAITRTKDKEELAIQLGATGLIANGEAGALEKYDGYFDYVLDTISGNTDYSAYLKLLAPRGSYCLMGIGACTGAPADLVNDRALSIQGSCVGGVAQTQEMLDYCAKENILPLVEMITEDYVNEAYERVKKSDVRFRFVIDVERSWANNGAVQA